MKFEISYPVQTIEAGSKEEAMEQFLALGPSAVLEDFVVTAKRTAKKAPPAKLNPAQKAWQTRRRNASK